MMYAEINGSTVVQYPANPAAAHTGTSFPNGWQGGEIDGQQYAVVQPVAPPAFDAATQRADETAPALVGGVWVQQWQVTDLTPEELAARLQARRQAMVVSPLQADLALTQAGLIDAVEAAVAAADVTTQKAWAKAKEFKRLSPLITGLAQALGWTDEQLDELFEAAQATEI